MARTRDQIERAVAGTDAWLKSLETADVPDAAIEDPRDLRRVGLAAHALDEAELALTDSVGLARAEGRSWTEIANVLGVSRQAARQRFSAEVSEVEKTLAKQLATREWDVVPVFMWAGGQTNELNELLQQGSDPDTTQRHMVVVIDESGSSAKNRKNVAGKRIRSGVYVTSRLPDTIAEQNTVATRSSKATRVARRGGAG
jgi:hypothetical protein